MEFPRRLHAVAVAAMAMAMMTSAASAATAEAAPDAPAVYYIRHAVSSEADAGEQVSNTGYYSAALQPASRGGSRLLVAPIWAQQVDAAGQTTHLMDLDPGEAEDAALLAVLREGFVAALAQSGEPGPLRAMNQAAWSALRKKAPDAAAMLLYRQQAPGLRPVPLPASVAVGDSMTGWQRIEPYGSVKADFRVIEVTPTAVLMDMALEGADARGEGRLVVQRGNGMPIELRMEIHHQGGKDLPASIHRVHLADMRHDPMLHMAEDVESYVGYVEQVNQTLQNPPFSSASSNPSAYTHRSAESDALEDYMVGADALPAFVSYTGSFWIPAQRGSGRRLALGSRAATGPDRGSRQGQQEPILMSRLHRVEMLDAHGAPIAGLEARPVTSTLFFPEKYSATQTELGFPFHLPLGAPRAALGRIEAVRVVADAEVYAFETTEILDAGEHSALNPDITLLRPSAHRATLLQGRQSWKEKTGLYSVVVPLDAEGNALPSEQLVVAPLKAAQPARLAQVPLAWENSSIPMRTEIATIRPIARLQIRHYRWRSIPKTWTFPMRD